MKHVILPLFLGAICIVKAQQPGPPPDGPMGPDFRPPGGDKIGRAFFPPELVMRNQKAINLTPDQQTAIREEMRNTLPRFTELQWQLSAEEETLDALVRAESSDQTQILAQFDRLMLAESELKRVRFALLVKLKALLTTQQRQKLEELKRQQRPGEGGHRPPPREDGPENP